MYTVKNSLRVLLIVVTLLATFDGVFSTHFRYGHINWRPNQNNPNRVSFNVLLAFRRSYPWSWGGSGNPENPNRGDTLKHGSLCFGAETCDWRGRNCKEDCTAINLAVKATDNVDDWISGDFAVTYNYPANTGKRSYIATYTSVARISTLHNNKDTAWYISTNITTYVYGKTNVWNTSPSSNNMPIVIQYVNKVNTFNVLASDVDGNPLTFSIAPGILWGGPGEPIQTPPPAFSISRAGVVTWNTNGLEKGLWCVQIYITDGFSYVVVDFLLDLQDEPISEIPYFIAPTPNDGAFITFPPGVRSEVTLRAKSENPAVSVEILTGSTPGASALSNPTGTNPVSEILSWTPTNDDIGVYIVTLTCRDSKGVTSAGQQSFIINVAAAYCINGELAQPNCDTTTGNCVCRCNGNFEGDRCQVCKPGYFGSNCEPCPYCGGEKGNCNDGILGTGTCLCNAGWKGDNCTTPLGIRCDPTAPNQLLQTVAGNQLTTPQQATTFLTQDTTKPALAVPFRTPMTLTAPALDVLVLVDNTASVSNAMLTNLKGSGSGEKANTFISAVGKLATNGNALVGLATFTDIGGYVFRLVGPLSGVATDYYTAVNKLATTSLGSDTNACHLDALSQAATTAGVGWRTNSYKVVVVITDAAGFKEGGAYTTQAALKATLLAQNVVPVFLSFTASANTYTNLASTIGFGRATITDSTWSNAYTQAVTQIQTLVRTVQTVVVTDQYNLVTAVSSSTTISANANVDSSVSLDLPASLIGKIEIVPTVTVNTVGFSTQTIATAVNRSPLPNPCRFSTSEDVAALIPISGFDPDGNVMQINLDTLPAQGTIKTSDYANAVDAKVNVLYPFPDGNPVLRFQYTPKPNWFGTDSFTWFIDDGCAVSVKLQCEITVTSVNDAPVGTPRQLSTLEATPLEIELTGTDVEDQPSQLRVRVVSLPPVADGRLTNPTTGAAIAINTDIPNGRVLFTPNGFRSGYAASFQFQVIDTNGASSAATPVSVYVEPVPQAPVASAPSPVTAERTITLAIQINAFDPDPEEQSTFIITAVSTPGGGSFTTSASGGVTITNGYTLPVVSPSTATSTATQTVYYTAPITTTFTASAASITYKVRDAQNTESNTVTVTVNVKPNNPPTAINKDYSVNQDSSVTITLTGSDFDSYDVAQLRYTIQTGPAIGTLKYNNAEVLSFPFTLTVGNPRVVYTTYSRGTDQLTFITTDPTGASSNPATIKIGIVNVNHPPTTSCPTLTMDEDTTLTIKDQITSSDPDGDKPLTIFVSVSNKGTWRMVNANGGTTNIAANAQNYQLTSGTLSYTPPANAYGSAYTTFSYYVSDGQPLNNKSPTVTVTINVNNVNDAPTCSQNDTSIDETTTPTRFLLQFPVADIDTPVGQLSAIINTLPPSEMGYLTDLNGVTLSAGADVGTTRQAYFVTQPYKSGQLTFTYKGYDGALQSAGVCTFTIFIGEVNHPPEMATATTSVTGQRTILIPITLTASDPDDDDTLSFSITRVTPGNFGYFSTDGTQATRWTASVPFTVANVPINRNTLSASTTVYFLAPATTTTTTNSASFVYTVIDAGDMRPLAPSILQTTVTVNIQPNKNPTVVSKTISVVQDDCVDVDLSAADVDVADADNLKMKLVTRNPQYGTLTNRNGGAAITTSLADIAPGQLSYCTNVRNTETLNYQAIDNLNAASPNGVITITVIPVNHAPVARVGALSTREDVTLTVTSLSATDPDGDTITYWIKSISGPATGTFVQDSGGAAIVPGANGVRLTNGRLRYTPPQDAYGDKYAWFEFWAEDNGSPVLRSSVINATIDVTPVNDLPIATSAEYTWPEGTAPKNINLAMTDVDNTQAELKAYIASLPDATLGSLKRTDGTPLTVNSVVESPRDITWQPVQYANGRTSFRFYAHDGAARSSNDATVTINLTPVQDAPQCFDYETIASRGLTNEVYLNLFDPDRDTYSFYILSTNFNNTSLKTRAGANVGVGLVASGVTSTTYYATQALVFDATNVLAAGNSTFTFLVSDGKANSSICTVNIPVNSENTPPNATHVGPFTTNEEVDTQTFILAGVDVDVADQTRMRIQIIDFPSNGKIIAGGAEVTRETATRSQPLNNVLYRPNDLFHGNDSFTWQVLDGIGASSAKSNVRITVIHVNNPPTIAWRNDVTTNEDVRVDIPYISAADVDRNPPDNLQVIVHTPPPAEKGTLVQFGTTTPVQAGDAIDDELFRLAFIPFPNANAPVGTPFTSFSFYAYDGNAGGYSTTLTGQIFVNPVNDAPVAIHGSVSMYEDAPAVSFNLNATDIDSAIEGVNATIVSIPTSLGTAYDENDVELVPGANIPYPRLIKFKNHQYTYGAANLTFRVVDSDGLVSTNTGRISITVIHQNHAPVPFAASPVVATRGIPLQITLGVMDVDLVDKFKFDQVRAVVGAGSFSRDAAGNDPIGATTATNIVSNVNNTAARSATTHVYYHASIDATPDDDVTLEYKVNDGLVNSDSFIVTVDIAPNNPPTANPVPPVTVLQDGTSDLIYLSGSDVDVIDIPWLSVILNSLPTRGTLKSGDTVLTASDVGQYLQNPNLTYSTTQRGTDSFTFLIEDYLGDKSAPSTVSISITPVNHPPTGTFGGVTTAEDTRVEFNTINAFDQDGDLPLDVYITVLPLVGKLFQSDGTEITAPNTKITDGADYTLIYEPPADLNNANGPLTTFKFQVNDNQALNNLSPEYDAEIFVTPVNDAPVAHPGSLTVDENAAPSAITLEVTDIDTPLSNVTAIITSLPDSSIGTLTLNGNPVVAGDVIRSPHQIVFETIQYANGRTTFTFIANDGFLVSPSATFTITVNHVNQKPVASTYSPLTAIRGADVTVTLMVTDPDTPEFFDFVVTEHSSKGGKFVDVDGDDFPKGEFTIAKNVTKIGGITGVTSVTASFQVPKEAFGTDYATASFKVVDSFQENSNSATVVININPGVPPTTSPVEQIVFAEEGHSHTFNLNGTDADPADDLLITIITSLPTGCVLVVDGVDITVVGDSFARFTGPIDVSLRGKYLNFGTDSFTFRVEDRIGFQSDPRTVNIQITPINHRPEAFFVVGPGVEDTPLPFTIDGIDVDDRDKATLGRFVTVLPSVGSLWTAEGEQIKEANATHPARVNTNLVYRPADRQYGSPLAHIEFYVDDGSGWDNSRSETKRVNFVIARVDRPPVAENIHVVGIQNQRIRVQLRAVDPQDYDVTYSIVKQPHEDKKFRLAKIYRSDDTEITLQNPGVLADGVVYYVAPPTASDADREGEPYGSFSYKAQNTVAQISNEATVLINITKVNVPPTATPLNQTVRQGDRLSFNMLIQSDQHDRTKLSVVIVKTTANQPIFNGETQVKDGHVLTPSELTQFIGLSYTAPTNDEGVAYDSITYYVVDPNTERSEEYTIYIDVTHKYLLPEIVPVSTITANETSAWTDVLARHPVLRGNTIIFTFAVHDNDTDAENIIVNLNMQGQGNINSTDFVNGEWVAGPRLSAANPRVPIGSDGLYHIIYWLTPGSRSFGDIAVPSVIATDDTPRLEGGPYVSRRLNMPVTVLTINSPPSVSIPEQETHEGTVGIPFSINDVTVYDADAAAKPRSTMMVQVSVTKVEGESGKPVETVTLPNDQNNLCETTAGVITCYAEQDTFNNVLLKIIRIEDIGAGDYVVTVMINDLGVGAMEETEEFALTATNSTVIKFIVPAGVAENPAEGTTNNILTPTIAASAAAGAGAAVGLYFLIKRRKPPTSDFFGMEGIADSAIVDNPLYEDTGGMSFDNVLYEPQGSDE